MVSGVSSLFHHPRQAPGYPVPQAQTSQDTGTSLFQIILVLPVVDLEKSYPSLKAEHKRHMVISESMLQAELIPSFTLIP